MGTAGVMLAENNAGAPIVNLPDDIVIDKSFSLTRK
jgi:hypothetical protein